MTMGELHDALSRLGPITLKRTLEALANGTLTRTPQNHEEATYAPMVNRDTGKIDWSASAQQIHNLVRGTNPFPVSFSFDETGARIKIWRTLLTGEKRPASLEPGSVTEASKDGILVAAGDAMLRIMELQAPSAKKNDGRRICQWPQNYKIYLIIAKRNWRRWPHRLGSRAFAPRSCAAGCTEARILKK